MLKFSHYCSCNGFWSFSGVMPDRNMTLWCLFHQTGFVFSVVQVGFPCLGDQDGVAAFEVTILVMDAGGNIILRTPHQAIFFKTCQRGEFVIQPLMVILIKIVKWLDICFRNEITVEYISPRLLMTLRSFLGENAYRNTLAVMVHF